MPRANNSGDSMTTDKIEDMIPGLRTSTVAWGEDMCRGIVHMLVTRSDFLMQHRDHIDVQIFPDRIHQVLFNFVCEYVDEFRTLPSRMIVIEKVRGKYEKLSPADWVIAENEIYQIYEYDEPLADAEYMERMLVEFYRRENVKGALRGAFDKLMSSEEMTVYDEIREDIRRATEHTSSQGVISDYFSEYQQRLIDMESEDENTRLRRFPIGITKIDNALGGGIGPGETGMFLGDSGTGKSQILTHVSAHNAVSQQNVYFISVENLKPVVERRHDSRFSTIPMNSLKENISQYRAALDNYAATCYERLKIACYPMGSVTINEMRADLDKLTARTGWRPDVVVLDYIDEVKFSDPRSDSYQGQGIVVRDFCQWMQNIGAGGFTATQASRKANDVETVTRSEMGDSYLKVRRADCIWTLNSSEAEHSRNLCRIYVDKMRNAPDKQTVYCEKDFSRCYFHEIMKEEYEVRLRKEAPLPSAR